MPILRHTCLLEPTRPSTLWWMFLLSRTTCSMNWAVRIAPTNARTPTSLSTRTSSAALSRKSRKRTYEIIATWNYRFKKSRTNICLICTDNAIHNRSLWLKRFFHLFYEMKYEKWSHLRYFISEWWQ